MNFAILIPVFNDPVGLEKTLKSLTYVQDFFLVLIVDDGSDVPIISNNINYKFIFKVIKLETNSGIEAALNSGLDYLSKIGVEFIARLDSGDTVNYDRFKIQREYLLANPEISAVGSFIDVINEAGDFLYQQKYPITQKHICNLLKYQNQLCHPSVMFRSGIFKNGLRYPLNYPAAEDYALFMKISKTHKLANIPIALTQYVVSGTSISSVKRKMQCKSRLKCQLDFFDALSIHSYLGVIRTLFLLYMPRRFSTALKKLISK